MTKKMKQHFLQYSFTLSFIGAILLFLLATPFVFLLSNIIHVEAIEHFNIKKP